MRRSAVNATNLNERSKSHMTELREGDAIMIRLESRLLATKFRPVSRTQLLCSPCVVIKDAFPLLSVMLRLHISHDSPLLEDRTPPSPPNESRSRNLIYRVEHIIPGEPEPTVNSTLLPVYQHVFRLTVLGKCTSVLALGRPPCTMPVTFNIAFPPAIHTLLDRYCAALGRRSDNDHNILGKVEDEAMPYACDVPATSAGKSEKKNFVVGVSSAVCIGCPKSCPRAG
ncbi:hypothetical protein HD554DRAFT_216888 [Boletus coccyginus]|nr:hypothetical protein HD554DRAFT_216888 [Boletus coccyginus]